MISHNSGLSHQIFNARTEHLDLLYVKKGYGVFNNNDMLMYLTHNDGKSVIAERFIKPLKANIYKKNNS